MGEGQQQADGQAENERVENKLKHSSRLIFHTRSYILFVCLLNTFPSTDDSFELSFNNFQHARVWIFEHSIFMGCPQTCFIAASLFLASSCLQTTRLTHGCNSITLSIVFFSFADSTYLQSFINGLAIVFIHWPSFEIANLGHDEIVRPSEVQNAKGTVHQRCDHV